ncbi:hypothetical protein IscW_ISCW011897, partial [Ixodes scapularis]
GYNALITGARRLGKSETVLIIFEGRKVAHFAFYKWVWFRCNLYKNQVQVSKLCYRTGHRSDICLTPQVKRCPGCGKENPIKSHPCTPKCLIGGGAHFSGSKQCRKRLETSYIVKQRRLQQQAQKSNEETQSSNAQPRCWSRERRQKATYSSSSSFTLSIGSRESSSTSSRGRSRNRGTNSSESRGRKLPSCRLSANRQQERNVSWAIVASPETRFAQSRNSSTH